MNQPVSWWLAQLGIPYNTSDPFASVYPGICKASAPAGAIEPDYSNQCEACLRARILIYWKSTPGDCVSAPPPPGSLAIPPLNLGPSSALPPATEAEITGLSTAQSALDSVPGVGLAIGGILDFIEEHARAVKTEQTTICSVCQYVNQVIPEVDELVATGQISPQQGVTTIAQLAASAKAQLAAIMKTCNAACYFQGYLDAQVKFASVFYPAIAPLHAVHPGGVSSNAVSSVATAIGQLIEAPFSATQNALTGASSGGVSVGTIVILALLALAAVFILPKLVK